MWECGRVGLYKWEVKYLNTPNEFGINGGRITYLSIRIFDDPIENGLMCWYDKDWITLPKNDVVFRMVEQILKYYN